MYSSNLLFNIREFKVLLKKAGICKLFIFYLSVEARLRYHEFDLSWNIFTLTL